MKKLIFFCCIFLFVNSGYAQNEICISYDAAGNRIKRKLCCTACLPPPPNTGVADRDQASAASGAGKLSVIPNPNTGVFLLNTEGIPSDAQVILLDMAGTILLNRHLGDGRFDISAFPSGTYVISVTYDNTRKTILFEKSSH
jgi:hypothetical protein